MIPDISTDAAPGMTWSALRTLAAFAGGYAVSRGWVTHQQLLEIGPALATLAVAGWGMYSQWKHKQDVKVLKAA